MDSRFGEGFALRREGFLKLHLDGKHQSGALIVGQRDVFGLTPGQFTGKLPDGVVVPDDVQEGSRITRDLSCCKSVPVEMIRAIPRVTMDIGLPVIGDIRPPSFSGNDRVGSIGGLYSVPEVCAQSLAPIPFALYAEPFPET